MEGIAAKQQQQQRRRLRRPRRHHRSPSYSGGGDAGAAGWGGGWTQSASQHSAALVGQSKHRTILAGKCLGSGKIATRTRSFRGANHVVASSIVCADVVMMILLRCRRCRRRRCCCWKLKRLDPRRVAEVVGASNYTRQVYKRESGQASPAVTSANLGPCDLSGCLAGWPSAIQKGIQSATMCRTTTLLILTFGSLGHLSPSGTERGSGDDAPCLPRLDETRCWFPRYSGKRNKAIPTEASYARMNSPHRPRGVPSSPRTGPKRSRWGTRKKGGG